jgi:hypothetical protein
MRPDRPISTNGSGSRHALEATDHAAMIAMPDRHLDREVKTCFELHHSSDLIASKTFMDYPFVTEKSTKGCCARY